MKIKTLLTHSMKGYKNSSIAEFNSFDLLIILLKNILSPSQNVNGRANKEDYKICIARIARKLSL